MKSKRPFHIWLYEQKWSEVKVNGKFLKNNGHSLLSIKTLPFMLTNTNDVFRKASQTKQEMCHWNCSAGPQLCKKNLHWRFHCEMWNTNKHFFEAILIQRKYTYLNPAPAWIMARKGQTGPSMHKHSGTLRIHFFCLLLSASYTHTHTDHTPFALHRISRKLDIFPQIVCCSPHKKTHTSLAVTLDGADATG